MIGLGSNATLGLGVAVYLRDYFSANASKISQSFNNLNRTAVATMRSSSSALIGLGAGAIFMGSAITHSFSSSVAAAKDFQNHMVAAKAMAQETSFDMGKLQKVAFDMSKRYAIGPTEIAETFRTLVQAGVTMEQIPGVMESIVKTAIAADEKIAGESGVAMGLVRMAAGWNKGVDEINNMADVLAFASVKTTLGFDHFKESMDYGQDVFRTMKLSFNEAVALISTLGPSVRGSRAGIALSQGWLEMVQGASSRGTNKKKISALAQLGLLPEDLKAGLLAGPLQTLRLLQDRLININDTVEKQKILSDIFGRRGARGANPLLDFLSGKVKFGMNLTDFLRELNEGQAKGYADKVAKEKMTSYANQVKLFDNSIERLKITIGTALFPILTPLIQSLTSMLNGLTTFVATPFGKAFIKILAFAGPFLILAGTISLIVGVMPMIISGFSTLATVGSMAWGALSLAALRYLGIAGTAGAAFSFNSLGSLISSLGRIVIPASGLAGVPTFLRGFITMFGSFTPSVARAVNVLWPLTRGLSIFGAVLYGLNAVGISLREILRGVVFGFQSLWNGFFDLISFTDPRGGRLVSDLKADTSWYDKGKYQNDNITPNINPYEDKSYKNMQNLLPSNRNQNSSNKPVSQTVINLIMDGKVALTKIVNNQQEQDIYASLGIS